MQYDWIKATQLFDRDLPRVGKNGYVSFDLLTNELNREGVSPLQHEGSHSTKMTISTRGRELCIDGNIAKYGKLDNLSGPKSLDELVSSVNRFLKIEFPNLPTFTKGTKRIYTQGEDGTKTTVTSDGLIFQRLDICTNKSVGFDNEDDFIKAVSTQNYRRMIPYLFPNGKTCDWKSKSGNVNLIYAKVYNKAYELLIHALPKIKRLYGEHSSHFKYALNLIEDCKNNGVVRFEQGLRTRALKKYDLAFYGLFEESKIAALHNEFLNVDSKLTVETMRFETISEQLLTQGIVTSTKAANTTAMYAMQWMMGHRFDFTKTQPRDHRARLNKIGIDISRPCDISRFSPVKAVSSKTIQVQEYETPEWYEHRPRFRVVANS